MLSWDRMDLSKILDIVKIVEEDCPLGVVVVSDCGMVYGTFFLQLPYVFFPKGTSLK